MRITLRFLFESSGNREDRDTLVDSHFQILVVKHWTTYLSICFWNLQIRKQLVQDGHIFRTTCAHIIRWDILKSHDTRLEMWRLTGTRKQVLHNSVDSHFQDSNTTRKTTTYFWVCFLKFASTLFRNQLAQSGYIFRAVCTRWNILTFEYAAPYSKAMTRETRDVWRLGETRKQISHLISSDWQSKSDEQRAKLMSFAPLQLSKAAVHLHVTGEENGRLSAYSETYTVIRNFGVWRARTAASLIFPWPREVYIKRVLCKFFDPLNVRARRRRRSAAISVLSISYGDRSNRVAPARPITPSLRSLVISRHVPYRDLSRRLSRSRSRDIIYIYIFREASRRRRVAPLNTERIDSKTRPRVLHRNKEIVYEDDHLSRLKIGDEHDTLLTI